MSEPALEEKITPLICNQCTPKSCTCNEQNVNEQLNQTNQTNLRTKPPKGETKGKRSPGNSISKMIKHFEKNSNTEVVLRQKAKGKRSPGNSISKMIKHFQSGREELNSGHKQNAIHSLSNAENPSKKPQLARTGKGSHGTASSSKAENGQIENFSTRASSIEDLDQIGKGSHDRRASSNFELGDIISYDEDEHVFCQVDCEEDHLHVNDVYVFQNDAYEDDLNPQSSSDFHMNQSPAEPTCSLATPPSEESSANDANDENFKQYVQTIQAMVKNKREYSKIILQTIYDDFDDIFEEMETATSVEVLFAEWKGSQTDFDKLIATNFNIIKAKIDSSIEEVLNSQARIHLEASRRYREFFKLYFNYDYLDHLND